MFNRFFKKGAFVFTILISSGIMSHAAVNLMLNKPWYDVNGKVITGKEGAVDGNYKSMVDVGDIEFYVDLGAPTDIDQAYYSRPNGGPALYELKLFTSNDAKTWKQVWHALAENNANGG